MVPLIIVRATDQILNVVVELREIVERVQPNLKRLPTDFPLAAWITLGVLGHDASRSTHDEQPLLIHDSRSEGDAVEETPVPLVEAAIVNHPFDCCSLALVS